LKTRKQSRSQLEAAVTALSCQLASTVQALHLETAEHLRFTNELRVVVGLQKLPDDIGMSDLLRFRNDLLVFVTKILEVATAKTETKNEKRPVGEPFLG